MANFSATIPVALVEAANAHLEELGHGPSNFSIPASADGNAATHAGFHAWHDAVFRAAIQAMVDSGSYPGLTVTEGEGNPNFSEHCAAETLEWVTQENWHADPIMTGDQRTFNNQLWVSLMDYNVWAPPIGWREVVSEGYPAWVQPSGSHDAYAIGDRVSFNGANYESKIAANVWSPTVYPAGWQLIA